MDLFESLIGSRIISSGGGINLPSIVTFHDSDDSVFSIEAVLENKSIPMPSAIPDVPSGSTGMFTGWKDIEENLISFPYIPVGKIDLYPDFGLPAPVSLEQSSWELIDAICYGVNSYVALIDGVKTLCYDRNGVREEWYKVGDTKNITIGPSSDPETYEFAILDFEHDTITGTTNKAKITFGMTNTTRDTYATQSGYGASESYYWNKLGLWTSVIPSYVNKFSYNEEVSQYIKSVDKMSHNNNPWGDYNLSSKIWLLSNTEFGVYGKFTEGYIYPYYSNNANRQKDKEWWTRTSRDNAYYWYAVTTEGSTVDRSTSWTSPKCALSLCFCI